MAGIPTEASILVLLEKMYPGKIRNVYCASSGGGKYIAVIQFQKKVPSDEGRQRQAALLAFASFAELKHVFLVDEDVDCFDMEDVLWAMTTRFQADREDVYKRQVGTFVKERSKKDIEDAYEVRKSLEILAIQTSVNHFSEEELDELENTFRQMLERLRSHDTLSVEEYAEADWKLHDMIVQKSDNHYIRTVMDVLKSSLKRYQGLSVQLIANADNSMCEHPVSYTHLDVYKRQVSLPSGRQQPCESRRSGAGGRIP